MVIEGACVCARARVCDCVQFYTPYAIRLLHFVFTVVFCFVLTYIRRRFLCLSAAVNMKCEKKSVDLERIRFTIYMVVIVIDDEASGIGFFSASSFCLPSSGSRHIQRYCSLSHPIHTIHTILHNESGRRQEKM